MRALKNNTSEERRREAKRIIIKNIGLVCTGNTGTCTWGRCKFNQQCDKRNFTIELLPSKNRRLDNIKRLVEIAFNKKVGRKLPNSRPCGVHEIASEILGQCIYEHELVINCPATQIRIKKATTLNMIIMILKQKHEMVTGKKMFLPY